MREVLFRGQTRRLGEKVRMDGTKVPSNWVYGGICHGKGAFSIIYGDMDAERENPIEKFVVYTDTVGQYTGLTDKNGKKIFEGDIVKGLFLHHRPTNGVVAFRDGAFGLLWYRGDAEMYWAFTSICNVEYEVIGNIHDNPELLKGGEGQC
jgi:hypothetical protein